MMAEDISEFSTAELSKIAGEMNKSAKNLSKLLKNLFDWVQIQKGTLDFSPKDYLLKEIINQAIGTINQKTLQKEITIVNSTPDLISVYVDENMIKSVFRNLLSNAVKFTKQGGKVIVSAKEIENKMVEISVRHTGVGMSDYDVKRLFKIDEKVSSQGTEGEDSTGLGLFPCKEFVEKRNGSIWVESRLGEGTTFSFGLQVNKQ